MNVKVYNLQGQETGQMELSDKVFGVKVKPEVVHEVFTAEMNNQRQPWADTKGKGEVRGGGKKPWQQKGTGRARHGSIRSPIWKGGGVVFGPKTIRNYKTKINKKKNNLAIRMCLSDKAANGLLTVVEDFNFTDAKTKLFVNLLKSLPGMSKSVLVLIPEKDEKVLRMTRNLPKAATLRSADVNVMVLMNKGVVVTNKEGIAKLEKVFGQS